MEDPIVTLLDGTKIAKSKVPVNTVYINEKGIKVKKVMPAAAPKAPAVQSGKGDFFSKLAGSAAPSLMKAISSLDLSKLGNIGDLIPKNLNVKSITDTFKNLQGQIKGGNIKDVSGILSSLNANGGLDKNMISGLTSNLGNNPLGNVLGLVGAMNENNNGNGADAKEAFRNYLKIATADGVVSEDEYDTLKDLAESAGISESELAKIIG